MPSENLTILIDGSYALHRVLRVGGDSNPFTHMSNSDGIRTGGVFAYLIALSKSLSTFNVKSVVNVWDGGSYSKRRLAIHEGYKGSRSDSKMTDEGKEYFANFRNQKEMVNEFLQTLGIPSVTLPGKEADDIIGFLARNIEGDVMVLSDDKDYWQLINKRVCVYRPVKEQYLDLSNFSVETGFREPWRYLLYSSITGDAGDDVPGIPGIGGTTAERVANGVTAIFATKPKSAIVSCCNTLAATDTRNGARYRKVADNLDIIARNRKLIDLSQEQFSSLEQEALRVQMNTYHAPNDLQVVGLLQKYDMKSISTKINYWIMPFRRLGKPTFNLETVSV